MGGILMHDKELGARRIRVHGARHRKNAAGIITSIEQELPHIFKLSEEGDRRVYRCIYCEQEYNSKK